MILSHHQQHQLQRIETGLLRSDPQLTAMLGIFGKLSAGQTMPAWEQVPTRRDRIQQTAALTVEAITLAAAALCSTPRQTHAQHVPGQLPAVLPTARHGCGPAPLPARHKRHSATVIAR